MELTFLFDNLIIIVFIIEVLCISIAQFFIVSKQNHTIFFFHRTKNAFTGTGWKFRQAAVFFAYFCIVAAVSHWLLPEERF